MISLKELSVILVLMACGFHLITVVCQEPVEEMTAAATSGDASRLSKALDESYAQAKRDSDNQINLDQGSYESEGQLFELVLKGPMGIDSKRKDGKTALMVASCRGHLEAAKTLLKYGADVNAKGLHGRTPLMCAALRGHKDVAELLLERGADIKVKTRLGSSALSLATDLGHKQIVNLFIEREPELRFCSCRDGDTKFQ